MTNAERKDYYFTSAQKEYEAMQKEWENRDWNRVIRKAQETIELLLKGVLKLMNVEFPKEHEIGEYFEKILILKKIDYDEVGMKRIKEASKDLTDKRAPAYYGEVFYSQEEAIEAKQQAEFVREFIKELMKRLESK